MNTAACNPEKLATLRDIRPVFLAEIATVFLQDAPSVLMGIRTAVVAHEPYTLRLLTHRLKGSSGIFGADHLVALCDSRGDGGDMASWLAAVETAYAHVAAELARVA